MKKKQQKPVQKTAPATPEQIPGAQPLAPAARNALTLIKQMVDNGTEFIMRDKNGNTEKTGLPEGDRISIRQAHATIVAALDRLDELEKAKENA